MSELPINLDFNKMIEFINTPSFKTFELVIIIYFGLLWLSVIIWVTRDAINRSHSLIFQVIAILLNILFPILGILLYLIIRPGKTTAERYYEELEHQLILESISKAKPSQKKSMKSSKKTK